MTFRKKVKCIFNNEQQQQQQNNKERKIFN
jgi:hypothetical protein